jgi:flagellar biosynthesis GTPase FlhF
MERKSRAEYVAEKGGGKPAVSKGMADEEEEDDQPHGLLSGSTAHNPNLEKKQEKMLKVKDLGKPDENFVPDPEAGMNRKEREALAAIRAKEDYMKRHLAGETEQARKELERLAIVRKRREEAQKKRESEGRPPGWTQSGVASDKEEDESSEEEDSDEEEPTKGGKPTKPVVKSSSTAKESATPAATAASAASAALAAKKKAAALGETDESAAATDGGPPKLKAMDIKKMNGDQLKDHLKARGLDIQGQKKDLMKRLSDYEATRS